MKIHQIMICQIFGLANLHFYQITGLSNYWSYGTLKSTHFWPKGHLLLTQPTPKACFPHFLPCGACFPCTYPNQPSLETGNLKNKKFNKPEIQQIVKLDKPNIR